MNFLPKLEKIGKILELGKNREKNRVGFKTCNM